MTPLFDTLENLREPNSFINDEIRAFIESGIKDAGYIYELAVEFLLDNSASAQTFKTYRAEIEKFLLWSWRIHKRPVSEVDRISMRDYLSFLANPPQELIGTPTSARFKLNKGLGVREPNERWRPFVKTTPKTEAARTGKTSEDAVYSFKPSSVKLSLSILSSFYDYLIDLDYVEKNPPAIIKRKREFKHKSQVSSEEIKYLSEFQWQAVFETAVSMATAEPVRHARTRFLMALLYSLYPRISEVSARPGYSPKMSDFYVDPNSGAFLFKIPLSKGYKSRNVSVSDELKRELKLYREAIGLPPLPFPGESSPLFCKHVHTSGGIKILDANLGDRQLREIVQSVFTETERTLRSQDKTSDADTVANASPHWIRHTGISHDINFNKRSLSDVRDDAGHDSIETTSLYLHASSGERYASAKDKKLFTKNKH